MPTWTEPNCPHCEWEGEYQDMALGDAFEWIEKKCGGCDYTFEFRWSPAFDCRWVDHDAEMKMVREHRNDIERSARQAPKPVVGRPGTGFVYFIQAYMNGIDAVKIGFTRVSVESRLRDLQTACPVEMRILHIIEGATMASERAIHRRLHAHRLLGEWFTMCSYVRAEMV